MRVNRTGHDAAIVAIGEIATTVRGPRDRDIAVC
jgi:hypothetical protein